MQLLPSQGGWSGVLRVPATWSDEDRALDLLDNTGVLLQPGWFYDFPGEGHLVVSLLAEPAQFADLAARAVRQLLLQDQRAARGAS